jgi:hypothetical protein
LNVNGNEWLECICATARTDRHPRERDQAFSAQRAHTRNPTQIHINPRKPTQTHANPRTAR